MKKIKFKNLGNLQDFWKSNPQKAKEVFEYPTEEDLYCTVYECQECGKLSLLGYIDTQEGWEIPDVPGCEHWTGDQDIELID